MKYIPLISSIFLGLFFLLVGFDKLFHYDEFVRSVDGYVIIPRGISQYVAYPIIFSEMWIGVGLLIRPWRKVAAMLAVLTLFLFIVALSINYAYAPGSSCGCWFTLSSGTVSFLHIAQNVVFIGLAIFVWKNTT